MTAPFALPEADSAEDGRPTVLVLLGCFSRGIEATGPNQSLLGMVAALPQYRFRVVGRAAPGDVPGRWTTLAGVEQLPLRSRPLWTPGLRRAVNETPHDLVIANSFFDDEFTIPLLLLRRFGLVRRTPVLLAPRGEFSAGALSLKSLRKRLHLKAARTLGLVRDVAIQATSPVEAEAIRAALPFAGPVLVGPNVRELPPPPPHLPRAPGEPLRVGFVGRIVRMKNLDFALDLLARADFPVRLDLIGPIEDLAYWQECRTRIERLPAYVEVVAHGEIPRSEVIPRLAAQDLLLHPSLGENYGHAIADSLIAGTPVLVSDRTPWRGLEQAGAGWDVPLEAPDRFLAVLRDAAAATPEAQAALRRSVRAYAERALDSARLAQQLAECLEQARLAGAAPGGARPPASN